MKQFEEYKTFTLRDGTKFKARDKFDSRLYEEHIWNSLHTREGSSRECMKVVHWRTNGRLPRCN